MMNNLLLGAIIGDVCGSWYEWKRTKNPMDVNLYLPQTSFTDDTIGTIATAYALMNNISFTESYQYWFRRYNAKGCGKLFKKWVYEDNPKPYGSWGNGSAMRVSPVAYVSKSLLECLDLAKKSAECTHNSTEGIKGAQCIAEYIWTCYNENETNFNDILKKYYPEYITSTLDKIRPDYHFDSSCQGSVPVAVLSFLESESYEDCIINAISMGGDADTLAAMAGSIAYPYYGKMSVQLSKFVLNKLPKEFIDVIEQFDEFVFRLLCKKSL